MADECAHCGKPIEQCEHGCWHHGGANGSIFCQVPGSLRIAEPKATS